MPAGNAKGYIVRILAIDYGERRLGLALSDPLMITAQGLENYQRAGFGADVAHLRDVIAQYGVDCIVLGWPRNMNGTEGEACRKVSEFALMLESELDIRLDFWDERLSSAMAQQVLIQADVSRKKRKGVLDKMAASVILQGYMDAKAYNTRRELPWKKIASSN